MTEKQQQNDTLVQLRNVTFYRGDRRVLDDVSLDAKRGQIIALMGPSGVGKSTLLKMITGQLTPDYGTVEVANQCISSKSTKDLKSYRRKIGVLLQNGALFTDLDCFENVALPLREHTQLSESLIHRVVLGKLHAVGLRGAARLMPRQLSGGMARRVALARTVALDPELVLYDEPLAGLDPISLASVMRLIRSLNSALGLTSIIVTHNVDEMSVLADYAYLLIEGQVAAHGTPDELANHDSPIVHQFMNGLPDGPVPFHYPAADLATDLLATL
ncbi:MAG: phospholipid ABC transporter ATP-binding protein MlaF [Wenzhouxiangellaceae bacterium]